MPAKKVINLHARKEMRERERGFFFKDFNLFCILFLIVPYVRLTNGDSTSDFRRVMQTQTSVCAQEGKNYFNPP